jgi:hypothetical protein
MSEKITVTLMDIADKLEETSENWTQYLNIKTDEFVVLSDGSYFKPDYELAEKIEYSGDYVRLPTQHNINEYSIMEAFAEATTDAIKREQLFRALKGRKPFRHFKDTMSYLGLEKAYYAFRHLAFLGIAKEWCEEHNIPYGRKEIK